MLFLDECGLLMAPLVRRSWAPLGQTPILYQRTRSREKVLVIGVLSLSPGRRRVGLYFSLLPGQNVTGEVLVDFLRELRTQFPGPIVLVWDRLAAHRSKVVKKFLAGQKKIHIEFLPPYAPELNPVEYVWGHLKGNALTNLAPEDAATLARIADRETSKISKRPNLLRGFLKHSPLFP